MNELRAEHLIVGAGTLGLATADHLLRRGAGGVLVLEARSGPGQCLGLEPGLILTSGLPAQNPHEERARLLLEEWRDYIEVDPCYRAPGAVALGAERVLPAEWPRLTGADLERIVQGVDASGFANAALVPNDGWVDPVTLTSALHWQVRKRGGRVLSRCRVDRVARSRSGFEFEAGGRRGTARRAYLAAGAANVPLAHLLGLALGWGACRHHQWNLAGAKRASGLLRLRWSAPAEATPLVAPGILEGPEPEGAGGESAGDAVAGDRPPPREAVYWRRGDGSGTVRISLDAGPGESGDEVDWGVWSELVDRWGTVLPEFAEVEVVRASARAVSAPTSPGDSVSPRSGCAGTLLAAGSFGGMGLALALSVAEQMAELGLGLPTTTPEAEPDPRE